MHLRSIGGTICPELEGKTGASREGEARSLNALHSLAVDSAFFQHYRLRYDLTVFQNIIDLYLFLTGTGPSTHLSKRPRFYL